MIIILGGQELSQYEIKTDSFIFLKHIAYWIEFYYFFYVFNLEFKTSKVQFTLLWD